MTDPESGTIAVLAEKPSVARDVAHELGATGRGDGYLYGNGYVVTWAIGHLVALAQPHEINPEWRHWRRDRRRPRGRVDLPLYLRGVGVPEAVQPVVDLFPHAGGHP